MHNFCLRNSNKYHTFQANGVLLIEQRHSIVEKSFSTKISTSYPQKQSISKRLKNALLL